MPCIIAYCHSYILLLLLSRCLICKVNSIQSQASTGVLGCVFWGEVPTVPGKNLLAHMRWVLYHPKKGSGGAWVCNQACLLQAPGTEVSGPPLRVSVKRKDRDHSGHTWQSWMNQGTVPSRLREKLPSSKGECGSKGGQEHCGSPQRRAVTSFGASESSPASTSPLCPSLQVH